MSDKVRVGFIGAGGIAGEHIKHLLAIDGVEVVALADPAEGTCERHIKSHGLEGAKPFRDYKKLLKMADVDAVSVCTPNWLHYKPTIAALRAGKHVLVEKPMAMSAREAQAMCDAAKKAAKVLCIGFQQRFRPEAQFIRRCIDEGELGDLLYCRAWALRRRGIPSWGVFGRKDLQGGGPLIDIGVHILEVSHYLLGKPRPIAASAACWTYLGDKKPEATTQMGDWDYKTYTVEDLATGYVRFEGGITLTIESSFAAHIGDQGASTTLMGTKGGAKLNGGATIFKDYCGKMVNIQPQVMEREPAFGRKMQNWIRAIRGGENIAPGEDGLAVQKILDGHYRSAERGKEVAIK